MKANMALTGEDIKGLQMVYAKELSSALPVSAGSLRAGVIGTTTPSRQPVLISLNPIAGESVTSRDGLYLRTDVALNCLSAGEGVLGLVEEIIMSLPDDPADPKGAFACTTLDQNFCRLKGLFGDLQRAEIVQKVGDYGRFKQVAADNIELLARDSRDYVAKAVGDAKTMENGLSPADFETVQSFNHLRRVMSSVFKLPIDDGEVYLDAKPQEARSLDDTEQGGMNRVFAGISYSGTQRPFFLKYVPYYLLTMNGSMFLNALSRPRQLSAVTSRPGPLALPRQVAAAFGVPHGASVSYHSVSRYGETNQRENPAKKGVGPPMKFYYSYEDKGVTRVLTMDRRQHFFVQLVNRLPVEIPAGVINNPEPVKAKYIMYDYKNKAYIYEAGRTRHALPQSQHQKILQHNAKLVDMADPNAPVHLTHMADGSLDTVMNRLFNDLAAKAVSNKSYIVEFLPSAHRERIKLMKELTEKLRPDFEREQSCVEAIRSQLFEEFAAGRRQKDTIEDACRKEALRGFRALVAEKRVAMPPERGLSIIENAADVINRKFGAMYQSKADEFAKAGTARALYRKKVEPFHSVFKSLTAKHNGFLNITAALEELGPANRTAFDALLLDVNDRMAAPGGLRDTLEATYWGGVTQNLMDLNYGPEGIHADGSYIGREGLPRNSREFVEYLSKNAPELASDPVQVANRLSKTFASFEFHVSPYHSLPWPNLYRENDLMRKTGQPVNTVRDSRTLKPKELPVDIVLAVDVVGQDGQSSTCSVPMTGKGPRDATRRVDRKSQEPRRADPAPVEAEPAEIASMS